MTEVVSLRMPPSKVAELDRRAKDRGVDRSKYVMGLIDQDLAKSGAKTARRFASMHLLGRFNSKGSTNAEVRAALKVRGEKDR